MADELELIIVGPGRLGRSAAQLLQGTDLRFELIARHQAIPAAKITWLTVPDGAISDASKRVPRGGVVLHASGACDVDVLHPHVRTGSLHPLMTFPGPELALPRDTEVPAAVAGHPEAVAAATALAEKLGFTPFEVSGDRALYHAAAVMAGNFATVLLGEASRILTKAGVPEADAPRLLAPLALTSIRNAADLGPGPALTGPVARGDEGIIDAHLRALQAGAPMTRETYQALLAAARDLRKRNEPKE